MLPGWRICLHEFRALAILPSQPVLCNDAARGRRCIHSKLSAGCVGVFVARRTGSYVLGDCVLLQSFAATDAGDHGIARHGILGHVWPSRPPCLRPSRFRRMGGLDRSWATAWLCADVLLDCLGHFQEDASNRHRNQGQANTIICPLTYRASSASACRSLPPNAFPQASTPSRR